MTGNPHTFGMRAFLELSASMQATTPVFIVGLERSGTSILYRLLQQHPSFTLAHCSPGFELTESCVFSEPTRVYARSSSPFRFMLNNEECYNHFRHAVSVLPPLLARVFNSPRLKKYTDRNRWSQSLWWKLCQNHHLIRHFFYYAMQARGVTRLIDKTPRHLARLPEIRATFPQAKVICTLRHPVDVFSSYLRRFQVAARADGDASTLKWLQPEPEQFCKSYRRAVRTAFAAHRADSDNFLLLWYDAFTQDPMLWLPRVCDFIHEPALTDWMQQDAPTLGDWEQDPLLAHAITPNSKVWSDYMPESTAQLIETRLADLLQEAGLACYTRAPQPN